MLLMLLLVLPAAARGVPEADTFLWKISRQGRHVGYLIGTIHVGKKTDTLPPHFQAALQNSRRLVVESETIDEDYLTAHPLKALQVLRAMFADQPLKQTVGIKRLNRINALVKGSPVEELTALTTPDSKLAPQLLWFELGYAVLPAEFSLQHGIDQLLIQAAKQQHKPIHGLEFDEPYLLLKTIPADVTLRNIDYLLDHRAVVRREIAAMWDNYRRNRARVLWRQLNQYRGPAQDRALMTDLLNNQLLKQRNLNWLPGLERHLQTESSTVAVGAAHLFGEHGLIVQLRRRGYTVEPQPAAAANVKKRSAK